MSASSSLVFPVLGVVLSNALYFSPAPAVVRAASVGNLGSLNPIPLALMVVSTFAWMCYAFAVPNGFIVASNLPGAVAAVGFVATTLPLIPADAVSTRRTVGIALTGGALVSLLLWTYLTFAHVDHDTLVFVLGAHGSAICVLLFASPLSTLKEVLVTANAVSIYGPLTAAQCTNCAMWTIYGFSIGDIWVWGPNATGLVLGLAQLALKLIYESTPQVRPKEQQGLFSRRKDVHPSDDEELTQSAMLGLRDSHA